MTTGEMARGYLARGLARTAALRAYFDAGAWPDVVRESQEAVEILLKAALRHVGLEPTRTHDVGEVLRVNSARFPDWFAAHIPDLTFISAALAGDRGPAFYGDERRGIPPDQLFDRADAERAMEQAAFVCDLCRRLIAGES